MRRGMCEQSGANAVFLSFFFSIVPSVHKLFGIDIPATWGKSEAFFYATVPQPLK